MRYNMSELAFRPPPGSSIPPPLFPRSLEGFRGKAEHIRGVVPERALRAGRRRRKVRPGGAAASDGGEPGRPPPAPPPAFLLRGRGDAQRQRVPRATPPTRRSPGPTRRSASWASWGPCAVSRLRRPAPQAPAEGNPPANTAGAGSREPGEGGGRGGWGGGELNTLRHIFQAYHGVVGVDWDRHAGAGERVGAEC